MKTALAIAAAVVLLAGCGHANAPSVPKDPVVGTWRAELGPPEGWLLVVTKLPAGYQATVAYTQLDAHSQPIPPVVGTFTRKGNQLFGVLKLTTGDNHALLVYTPTTGHLTWRSLAFLGASTIMTKVSDSTAIPSPTATPSP
jgi:hypothetical protein